MKALLIEWNQKTGRRAGNINPKDTKLQCYGWQNMDKEPAIELRLIEDERNIFQYKNIEGVLILDGKEIINTTIEEQFPIKYIIEDTLIYEEHVKQKISEQLIIIDNLPDDKMMRLKKLKEEFNIKGIKQIKPMKV